MGRSFTVDLRNNCCLSSPAYNAVLQLPNHLSVLCSTVSEAFSALSNLKDENKQLMNIKIVTRHHVISSLLLCNFIKFFKTVTAFTMCDFQQATYPLYFSKLTRKQKGWPRRPLTYVGMYLYGSVFSYLVRGKVGK